MAVQPEAPKLDIPAPYFSLPATDGNTYALKDIMGSNGAVVVFICNHCPYVKAVIDRMVAAAETLADEGIGFAAICSNDASSHPDDSFENMQAFAAEHRLPFPYLHDESQKVAREYEAVCTPDFYGLDKDGVIRYRGRMDEGRTSPPPPGAKQELVEAMRMIAREAKAPAEQNPSMGCSIKWRATAG